MHVTTQISAFLVNKPGRLANICSALAKNKISIEGFSIADSSEHSVLRMVTDDPKAAKKVLTQLGTPYGETDVLVVPLSHRPGALAEICSHLAEARINIEYVYSSGAVAGRMTHVILKVSSMNRAQELLRKTVEK